VTEPCVTRWGRKLPGWVCDLAGGGDPAPEWLPTLAAVGLALLLGAAAWLVIRGAERAGSIRAWWDSLR